MRVRFLLIERRDGGGLWVDCLWILNSCSLRVEYEGLCCRMDQGRAIGAGCLREGLG